MSMWSKIKLSVFGIDNHILGNSLEDAKKNKTIHHQWTHNTSPENAQRIADCWNAMYDISEPQKFVELVNRLKELLICSNLMTTNVECKLKTIEISNFPISTDSYCEVCKIMIELDRLKEQETVDENS